MERRIYRAPDFWAGYLAYRTLVPTDRKSQYMRTLILCAQRICSHRRVSLGDTCSTMPICTDNEYRDCVHELCRMVILHTPEGPTIHRWFLGSTLEVTNGNVDESSLGYKRDLLSAAAWMGERSLVTKLVEDGCNVFKSQ